jgi:hypothetical protein
MIETSLQHDEPVPTPVRSFGKRARNLAGYTILAALMFVSPLRVFLPAALFHCGIRNGRRAAWLMLVLSTAIAALLVYGTLKAGSPAEAPITYGYLLGIFLAIAVPALAVLPMVERGERFGRVLIYALILSIAGLAVTELTMRMVTGVSPYAAQLAEAHATTATMVHNYEKAGFPPDAIRFFRKWMDIGSLCLPALLLIDVTLVFVFSLVMLGRLRAWRDFAVQRTPSAATVYLFRNLSLPEWLLFAFVGGGLTPLASGMTQQIGANVLAVVAFLYLLQGLAIFRSFVARTGGGFMGSLFAWMLLGFLALTGISQVLLCMAGLFDSFFDFRHFNRKDHSDESHSH